MPGIATMAIIAVAAGVGLVIIFKMIWRVAEPNEALIISGLGAKAHNRDTAESLGFKIVTGKGVSVLPGFQTCRRLSLDTRASDLDVNCVTRQGIKVHVRGVVIYKVGDDFASIANAARRFLDQQKLMDDKTHQLFAGHLRSIIGHLTVEDLIHNREGLTNEVRTSSATEMGKLGLVVDSLQIQEIEDDSGYIQNLGRPHAAAVASLARIAEAGRNQEATMAEQAAERENAGQIRDTQIKKAEYQGQVDQAAAEARTKGLAKAEAIKARATALAENQEAVIAQQLAEKWPEIVEAGAKVFGNVDNMVVLNGADGLEDMLAKALTLGGTGLGLARTLLSSMNGQPPMTTGNGAAAATAPAVEVVDAVVDAKTDSVVPPRGDT